MVIDQIPHLLAVFSGALVGFTLGLVGGGGSILAVPLLVYLVGVRSPHVAIGTSALAVAVNAMFGLLNHARNGNVNWRCGGSYAAAGVMGALAGSTLGKAIDGQKLLFLFALLMIVVGVTTYRSRGNAGIEGVVCNRENMPKVMSFGFGTGALSGFFGIGGGFLIVPGLVASTSMTIYRAIGTSLIAVAAFGLTTAISYAASGMLDWELAGWFISGGVIGTLIGTRISRLLAAKKGTLNAVFASMILIVACYIIYKSWAAISG